ncbi:MAG: adenylyltransferase, partial [Gammaproteobacteria bacterium]
MDRHDTSFELIMPHGGLLKDLYLTGEAVVEEKKRAQDYVSWDLTPRQICDIELLLNGGFSPLEGFLGKSDYDSVVETMRLTDGTLWPIPVNLDVSEQFAESISEGDHIALRDQEGVLIATMAVEDIWTPDK